MVKVISRQNRMIIKMQQEKDEKEALILEDLRSQMKHHDNTSTMCRTLPGKRQEESNQCPTQSLTPF